MFFIFRFVFSISYFDQKLKLFVKVFQTDLNQIFNPLLAVSHHELTEIVLFFTLVFDLTSCKVKAD